MIAPFVYGLPSFPSRYHDIDDEPSCRPLICDFENLPLEKETLRSEIVKEIRSYHSKHPRPKLTPLATKFFAKEINVKDAGQVDHNVTSKFLFDCVFNIFYFFIFFL